MDTDAGTVLGSMGYMSPEQVRGRTVDHRSDIFALGAILYEMLSGKRAFHGETPADTLSAILNHDPPDLSETNRQVAPALERIVRHCLEKNPAERFQSMRDIAFDLESLSVSGSSKLQIEPARALEGGDTAPLPIRGILPDEEPIGWDPSGKYVLVRVRELPLKINRLDPESGKREFWKQITPAEPAGVEDISVLKFVANGAYGYSYYRILSELYVVDGLK